MKVVCIDGISLGPAPMSRPCTKAVREGLLPIVEAAVKSGESGVWRTSGDGSEWEAHVKIIRSPHTGTVIAALALLAEPGAAPAPAPLVGAWEWVIELDENGNPTLRRKTHWDRPLFCIYEVSPDVAQSSDGSWEVGVWQNELISQTDQLRLAGLIRDGIKEAIGGIRTLTFDIITGYGTQNPGSKHLRLVGRIATENPPGQLLIQGVSYEASRTFHEDAWQRDAARVDDVLRGVLEVSEEPICVADPDTFEVLMTSPAWRRAGFSRTSSLVELFTEQTQDIARFIEEASNEQVPVKFERNLQIALDEGGAQDVQLSVCGVKGSDGLHMDAVVRVNPV